MFDNSFANQHRFDYSKPSDNEDDVMLDPNVMVNDDDDDVDVDVDVEIIPLVSKFKDTCKSSFVVSNDWELSYKHMLERFELKVKQTFSSKNKLVNVLKKWHIAHSPEYQV